MGSLKYKSIYSHPLLLLLTLSFIEQFHSGAGMRMAVNSNSNHVAHKRSTRSLRMDRSWTKSGYGIVFVHSNSFNQYELERIRSSVAEIRKYSCFRVTLFSQFQFYNDEFKRYPHYVYIEKNAAIGCGQAVVGMRGGQQLLTLSPDPRCLTIATITHEMLHSLGMEHEQSRPDRNQYISIYNPNVQPGLHNVFGIAYGSTPYGPYDFDSIMHYGRFAFSSSPNNPTLSSKVAGHVVPYSGNFQLSYWDKRKINFMTGCKVNA